MAPLIVLFLLSACLNVNVDSTLCFHCPGVDDPVLCDRATECGAHESCFLGEYLGANGGLTFDLSCKTKTECSSSGRKRAEEPAYLCAECCDTQGCNIIGKACKPNTGSSVNISDYQVCYKCVELDSPEKCDQVTFCAQGETCAMNTKTSLGLVLYTGSCQTDTECQNLANTPINYLSGRPLINKCCKGNFCNGFYSTFIDCSTPPSIAGTDFKVKTTSYGSTVEYTCSEGNAYLSGNRMAKCQLNGKWSQSTIDCENDCGHPLNVTGARVTFSATYTGSVATYRCYANRVYIGGTNTSTCNPSGKWDAPTINCAANCGSPIQVSGAVPHYTTTYAGSTVSYHCESTHVFVRGTNTSTCQSNGTWTKPTIYCAIDCGLPPTVEGAGANFTTTYFTSRVTYFCIPPYVYNGGDPDTLCREDGTWARVDFKCEVDCGTPPPISRTENTFNSTRLGQRALYTCLAGYKYSGGFQESTCNMDGSWTRATLTCIVHCGAPPSVTHATVDSPSTEEGDLVHYTCDVGYAFSSGVLVSSCQANGTWTVTNLVCKINCNDPPHVDYAFPTNTFPTLEGDAISYLCNPGSVYKSGDSNIRCQADGTWSSLTLVCEAGAPEPATV